MPSQGPLPGVPGVTYVLCYVVLVLLTAGQALDHPIFDSLKVSSEMVRPSIPERSRSEVTALEEDTQDSSNVMRAFMRVTKEQAMARQSPPSLDLARDRHLPVLQADTIWSTLKRPTTRSPSLPGITRPRLQWNETDIKPT